MWKESVVINRISVFDVPWLMVVAVCLMRWIYAPHQKRYLYIAMFFFGVCATIHQTMLCAAMGIEAAVAVTHPKLGRSFFLGNSIIFLGRLVLKSATSFRRWKGWHRRWNSCFTPSASRPSRLILAGDFTKETFNDLCRDGAAAGHCCFCAPFPAMVPPAWRSPDGRVGFVVLAWNTWKEDRGWLVVIFCGVLWLLGVSFYFYEADFGHDRPADAMGLSAHGGGVFPRAVPRPV